MAARRSLTIAIVPLCSAFSAAGETRHVPTEYTTIGAAVYACNDGDVVVIHPGTYTGTNNRDVSFRGKAITVRSLDPDDPSTVESTIIDCNGSAGSPHRGFYFTNNNIDADPLFVDPDGPDDDPLTWADNDFQLGVSSPCIDAGDNASVPADAFDLDSDGDLDEPLPVDAAGAPRFVDDPATPDTGSGSPPVVDIGAYEWPSIACAACDANCDGSVNGQDIQPFRDLLLGAAGCGPCTGDTNADGSINGYDIQPFIECLRG